MKRRIATTRHTFTAWPSMLIGHSFKLTRTFMFEDVREESDPEWWTYHRGMPDRSGISQYLHLARSKYDPERMERKERHAKHGMHRATVIWQEYRRASKKQWAEQIEELMRGENRCRTFNEIVLVLSDLDVTADTVFGGAPDQALWELVERGVLWWTCEENAVFFLHRDWVNL